jgi:glyoxylase-like metal-dependent hydrolase (beta-lactamase superfamily II)
MALAAPPTTTPLAVRLRTPTGETDISDASGWRAVLTEEPWTGPGKQMRLKATWRGDQPVRAGLIVSRKVADPLPARVMVPGLFYGDNGSGSPSTRYPRLGPLDQSALTSPSWDFASVRSPVPGVFIWTAGSLAWMAVEPHGTGIGFGLSEDEGELRLHRPGLERPFRHDRLDETPLEPLVEVAPGGTLELRFWYGDAPVDDPTGFAEVQRAVQEAWTGNVGRHVDTSGALAAADAAIEGLLRWHYKVEQGTGVLAETVSFDRTQVRDEMHISWISGAPTAYAMLRHGLTRDDEQAATAARSVLDTVSGGLAPCGAFWGIWTPNGWRAGWNGGPTRLHARTLAEATLFLLRALSLEPDHPNWAEAARSNLDYCVASMDDAGNPGSYYDAITGEVLDRRGTAGLLWAAALAEAAVVLDTPGYRDAAMRVGASYVEAIRLGQLLGAPEDIGLCPSSEDTYNAVISMVALWNATNDRQWLDMARIAADWLFTYRWSYNVQFPAGTPLARRGYRTRGADIASPSNNHIHMYGLICQRELFQLSRLLEDPWYSARATAHLACFVGEVALRNGQFGGAERRGMIAEQWYTTDWSREGRAGYMAPVSHAWCLGLLLLACEEWADQGLYSPTGDVDVRPHITEAARIKAARYVTTSAHAGETVRPPRTVRRAGDGRGASPTTSMVGKPHSVRLLPGFYGVGGGYLTHWRDAASYLLVDETTGECVLVDCGSHAGLSSLRANVSQVADLDKLKLVVGTHCHWDHVEAFAHLREETDALFAIHALDARAVRVGDPDLTCAGFLYNDVFHPFPIDITLHGGERFHVGEYDLEILHLPGHTPGCIGVMLHYRRTDQTILIPGDSVQGAFGKQIKSSVPHWKKSVRSLMTEKIDFMVTNHLPPGAQTSLLADVQHRLARIYGQLQTNFYSFADRQWE